MAPSPLPPGLARLLYVLSENPARVQLHSHCAPLATFQPSTTESSLFAVAHRVGQPMFPSLLSLPTTKNALLLPSAQEELVATSQRQRKNFTASTFKGKYNNTHKQVKSLGWWGAPDELWFMFGCGGFVWFAQAERATGGEGPHEENLNKLTPIGWGGDRGASERVDKRGRVETGWARLWDRQTWRGMWPGIVALELSDLFVASIIYGGVILKRSTIIRAGAFTQRPRLRVFSRHRDQEAEDCKNRIFDSPSCSSLRL